MTGVDAGYIPRSSADGSPKDRSQSSRLIDPGPSPGYIDEWVDSVVIAGQGTPVSAVTTTRNVRAGRLGLPRTIIGPCG